MTREKQKKEYRDTVAEYMTKIDISAIGIMPESLLKSPIHHHIAAEGIQL